MGRRSQLRSGPGPKPTRGLTPLCSDAGADGLRCGDSVLSRRLWRGAGRAPAVARRLRARARPGRRAREARAARRRQVADAPGVDAARRAERRTTARAAARAARRLGPRPPVVAGPDGPHAGAARRADDARLARLVRDLEVGRPAEADAAPERAAAPPRARQLRGARARHHARPGDAAVAQRHVEQPLGRQRELRARAAGAVLPRRRPRLQRARRAPARPGADRLPQRLDGRRPDPLPLRQEGSTTRATSASTASAGKLRLAGGRAARHAPPPPPRVHGHEALGLLHPDQALARRPSRRWRGCTWPSGRDVRPLLEAILAHPDLYDPAKRMVKPPVVQAAGMLRAVGRGIDTDGLGVAVRRRRPVPLPAAQRLRLGRHPLAGHRDVPRPLADGPAHLRARPARSRRGRRRARRPRRAGRRARSRFWGSPAHLRPGARRPGALRRRHAGRRRPSAGRRRSTPCWR